MSTRSKADWKARIEPHLSSSLETVSDKIMQTEAVQSWMRTATRNVLEDLGQQAGMQGEISGYRQMRESLEEEIPSLLAAVEELTEGCGHVDLHWRPFEPSLSRLYVDFDRDYSVTLFLRLSECTPDSARHTLHRIADALPEGEPFPNRPNTITGLVARDRKGVGVRVKEHLNDDRTTYRSVTLLPPNQSPLEGLSVSDAVHRLLQFLCASSPDGGAN